MKVEVLVAAMGQHDLSLYDRMNLHTDAVIANQCGAWGEISEERNGARVRMLSSNTRGVGKNRNLALSVADGDILVFADDDMIYYDDLVEGVEAAFAAFPKADVIFFGLDYTKNGEVFDKRRHKNGRVRIWDSLKYGACRLAVRRSAIMRAGISFSTLFGGGTSYGSGEDTLFIRECYRKGLRAYAYDHTLGRTAKDGSSWFAGYNEKYLYDKGAMIAAAFPKAKHLIKWYFILKSKKLSGFSLGKTRRLINKGIKGFRTLTPYEI